MQLKNQSLLIFVLYSAIIAGGFFWSGTVSQKTLYDKYIISLDGLLIPASDKNTQVNFYRKILDFAPMRTSQEGSNRELVSFQFPGKRRLIIEQQKEISSVTPLIRVRNGFEKLHKALLNRSGQTEQQVEPNSDWIGLAKGTVSQIFTGSFGPQFLVCDTEGNKMLFYNAEKTFFRQNESTEELS